jgi:Spy/CpxP family protein refolding chaperone
MIRVFAASAIAASLAIAQEPSGTAGNSRRQRLERLANYLDLTAGQREQSKAILNAAREAARPIRAQLEQGRQALADSVKAGKSKTEIDQLSQSQGALLGQLIAVRAESLGKIYALLTPDQRRKAAQLRELLRCHLRRAG